MKKYLPFVLLLFTINSAGQEKFYEHLPLIDSSVNYTIIIKADSLTKNQLFSKIKDWAVDSYKSQKATLQADDKEAGYLAYKGILITNHLYTGGIYRDKPYAVYASHLLKFYIKDEKVKVVFTDLELESRDPANVMMSGISKSPIPVHKIETMGTNCNQLGKRKKERCIEWNISFAKELNDQFQAFLSDIEKNIKSGKSEFDF